MSLPLVTKCCCYAMPATPSSHCSFSFLFLLHHRSFIRVTTTVRRRKIRLSVWFRLRSSCVRFVQSPLLSFPPPVSSSVPWIAAWFPAGSSQELLPLKRYVDHTRRSKKPVVKRGFIVSASNEDETEATDPIRGKWSSEVVGKPLSPYEDNFHFLLHIISTTYLPTGN